MFYIRPVKLVLITDARPDDRVAFDKPSGFIGRSDNAKRIVKFCEEL